MLFYKARLHKRLDELPAFSEKDAPEALSPEGAV